MWVCEKRLPNARRAAQQNDVGCGKSGLREAGAPSPLRQQLVDLGTGFGIQEELRQRLGVGMRPVDKILA